MARQIISEKVQELSKIKKQAKLSTRCNSLKSEIIRTPKLKPDVISAVAQKLQKNIENMKICKENLDNQVTYLKGKFCVKI